jgi:hypothetical protein
MSLTKAKKLEYLIIASILVEGVLAICVFIYLLTGPSISLRQWSGSISSYWWAIVAIYGVALMLISGVRTEIILEGVTFDTGSAKIKPASYGVLDKNADVLTKHKDMKINMSIEVQGSITDSNAQFKSGSVVTLLDLDFNKILADGAARFDQDHRVLVSGWVEKTEGKILQFAFSGEKDHISSFR